MNLLHLNNAYLDTPLYQHLYDALGLEKRIHMTFRKRNAERAKAFRGVEGFSMTKVSSSRVVRLLVYPKIRRLYQDVSRLVESDRPDLLHAHSLISDGMVAWRLKKDYGIRYVVAFRYTDELMIRINPLLLREARRVMRDAERVIFISPAHLETALGYLKSEAQQDLMMKYAVIPNGVDPFWLSEMGQPREQTGDPLRLLFVGEIIPRKNILKIAEAARELNERGIATTLTLVGWRDQPSRYEQKIKKKLTHPFIRMVKRTGDREQLRSLYRESDIYVMPSVGETFGLTFVEAMSQGLPVVYTLGHGIHGYFEDGHAGYGVKPHDVKDMADKILLIKENYEHLTTQALTTSQKFHWETIGRVYLTVYGKTLNTLKINAIR